MIVTAKDLRFKIASLFNHLVKGEEIIITFRGKPKAKLISYEEGEELQDNEELFGLWADRKLDVDEYVRSKRKDRSFE
jgi:prevent-host-death family protein